MPRTLIPSILSKAAVPAILTLVSASAFVGCAEREVVVVHDHPHPVEREVIIERGNPPPPQVEVIGVARGAAPIG